MRLVRYYAFHTFYLAHLMVRCAMLFVCLAWCTTAQSQTASAVNMNAKIIIDRETASFGSYLDVVSKQTGVVFSFSSKKIAADKILNLSTGNQTLEGFLKQINQKTGLSYKIVGTHIILLDNPPAKTTRKPVTGSTQTASQKSTQSQQASRQRPITRPVSTSKNTAAGVTRIDSTSKESFNTRQSDTFSTERKDTAGVVNRRQIDSAAVSTTATRRIDSVSTQVSTQTSSTHKESTRQVSRTNTSRRNRRDVLNREPPKTRWFLGGQFSFIAGLESKSESFRASGFGLNVKMEHKLGQRFAITGSAGFDHFMGNYTHPVYTGSPRDSTIDRFTIAPVLTGMKFYVTEKLFISGEVGSALKASSVTRTKLALSPSAGFLFPLKNNSAVDLSVKFTHIVRGYGLLERTALQNGGYSFISIRAAYGINR